jgi:hypothetical protein
MSTPNHRNSKQDIMNSSSVAKNSATTLSDRRAARKRWPNLPSSALQSLAHLIERHGFSIAAGDLSWIDRGWYVTHTGLLGLASRRSCAGIDVHAVTELCDPKLNRWIFCATVFPTRNSKGFSGYGDADPANVSDAMHGAELRIAETRAVNRALRKAYGVGLCSLEELGSFVPPPERKHVLRAPQPANGTQLEMVATPLLRDQLRQLIRQEQLESRGVKSYALKHLEVASFRDASREQVEGLLTHLRQRLFEDRAGFLADLAKLSADHQEVA